MTKLTNEEALKVLEALSSCKITGWDHGGPNMDYDEKKISEAVKLLQRPATPAPAGWVMPGCPFCESNHIRFEDDAPQYHWECEGCGMLFNSTNKNAWNTRRNQPHDWVLVPKKATQEMVDAALATQDIYTGRGALAGIGYEAMLAAAPAAPAVSNPDGWLPIDKELPPHNKFVWCQRSWVSQAVNSQGEKCREIRLARRFLDMPISTNQDASANCWWRDEDGREFSDVTVVAWQILSAPAPAETVEGK